MNKIKPMILKKAIQDKTYINFFYEQKQFTKIAPQACYEMTQTLYLRTIDFQVFEVEKIEKLVVSKDTF